mmetsp:Transcript_120650/g.341137  ORF Transcript_120650/g.341137 Transcript_120650/m.341137 type:complete len:265 (+) Transcript_120650:454-1248(+)
MPRCNRGHRQFVVPAVVGRYGANRVSRGSVFFCAGGHHRACLLAPRRRHVALQLASSQPASPLVGAARAAAVRVNGALGSFPLLVFSVVPAERSDVVLHCVAGHARRDVWLFSLPEHLRARWLEVRADVCALFVFFWREKPADHPHPRRAGGSVPQLPLLPAALLFARSEERVSQANAAGHADGQLTPRVRRRKLREARALQPPVENGEAVGVRVAQCVLLRYAGAHAPPEVRPPAGAPQHLPRALDGAGRVRSPRRARAFARL